jgi:hypothetical protein
MPDISSTFFGFTIAFLAPGMVGLFSLKYWFASVNQAFHTILTAKANAGLFLFVILAALVLGLVVSAIRWVLFEVILERLAKSWVGDPPTEDQMEGKFDPAHLAALRAAVDETYRYHQLYGGLAITFPALFVGWLRTHGNWSTCQLVLLWVGFTVLELLMIAGALDARRRYHKYSKSIFA